MHKVIQKPDGTLLEVVQESELQVKDTSADMGQQTMGQQAMGQPQVQQQQAQPQTQSNPVINMMENISGGSGSDDSGDSALAQEEREFNAEQAREKKLLDDFAK